ncbi:hypothetical protein BH11MYX2_BH11MYX2_17600 [soil metagenome]
MIVKVEVTPTARDAFAASTRGGGQTAKSHPANGVAVWRLLMPKTRNHVYYERDAYTNTVRVLLVANAIAEHAPAL